MLENPYQYALVLYSENGAAVGSVAVEADWEPATEWTRFYFVRKGELPLSNGSRTASIQPLWDRTSGEPYCRGFRVSVPRNGGRPVNSDFTTTYFRTLANTAWARLAKEKKLEAEEYFKFVVVAFPAKDSPERSIGSGLGVKEKEPVLPWVERSFQEWAGKAKAVGVVDTDDMPVFIPQRLLDEAAARTEAERGRETGGVLIGHLCHDAGAPEVFAEVTAQIPAEHTSGDLARLTFTAETWAAAEGAIKLRGRSEIYLGYWHSHPVREWCKSKECTPEKQKTCKLAKDFFSSDDQALLRAVFPRAYSLGLVVNDTAFAGLSYSLFGWREGSIQPRGFYLLEENHAT